MIIRNPFFSSNLSFERNTKQKKILRTQTHNTATNYKEPPKKNTERKKSSRKNKKLNLEPFDDVYDDDDDDDDKRMMMLMMRIKLNVSFRFVSFYFFTCLYYTLTVKKNIVRV